MHRVLFNSFRLVINSWQAEYLYVLNNIVHFSPIFILLISSIPVVSMYIQSAWKSVDPDQIASAEADLDLQCFQKMINLDKIGVFHANQKSVCLGPHLN